MAAKKIRTKILQPDFGITTAERAELTAWEEPGQQWTKRFAKRNGLDSVILHGEAGDVDLTNPAIVARVNEIKLMTVAYDLENIYNMDDFELFFKCLPRRSYLAPSEKKKIPRGSKKMKAKDRITCYVCTNATGSQKVATPTIGKS